MSITETISGSKAAITAPESMRAASRWNVWKREFVDGKEQKKPVYPCNATQPKTWLTFEQAVQRAEDPKVAGIGFTLGDTFCGIDLDGCRDDDGTLNEAAIDLLALGTYCEESPSGKGLHAIFCGTIPRYHKDPGFEIYDGAPGHARWFTFTGAAVGDVREVAYGPELQGRVDAYYEKWFAKKPKPEAPKTFSDDEVIELCGSFKNGADFQKLLRGEKGKFPSASEADLAFLRMARFVTRDRAQLDRLFRHSGRMRAKWDEKRGSGTYGEERIALAISMGGKVYNPKKGATSLRERELRAMFWWVQRIRGYGEAALGVLLYLSMHADADGKCFPARDSIARDLGIHIKTVDNAIETLELFGILRKSQRFNSSNTYTLRHSLRPGEPIELRKKPLRTKDRKSASVIKNGTS
jgi:primase-polymerase (primpol)-like protein